MKNNFLKKDFQVMLRDEPLDDKNYDMINMFGMNSK